jgi:hypothetical protein
VRPYPSAEIPVIARKLPAGRWLSSPEPPARSGQPVPPTDPVEDEIEALAALLVEVVELTCSGAMYPGHLALIADQAQGYESVQRALRGER